MIFVEGYKHRVTVWGDGTSAHLVSDTSVDELRDFAEYIRLPRYWMKPFPIPHFELAPVWRRTAIKHGAVDCAGLDRQEEYLAAIRRFVDRNPQYGLNSEPKRW